MTLPKIELTEDNRERLNGIRQAYKPAMGMAESLAAWADSERLGVLKLHMAAVIDGPEAIHQEATRCRMCLDYDLARGLRLVADAFEAAAKSMNVLLDEKADFDQDGDEVSEELFPLVVAEALRDGE